MIKPWLSLSFVVGLAFMLTTLQPIEGNPYVLPGQKEGSPIVGIQKPWRTIRAAAKLDDVRLHDLRHSFASVGADANLGLPILGALLGHSQAATTHRYAHLSADPLKHASALISDKIQATLSGATKAPRRPAQTQEKGVDSLSCHRSPSLLCIAARFI